MSTYTIVVNHNISKIFSLTRAEARLGWFMILNVLVCFDLVVDVWMCLFDLILDLKFIRRLSFEIWFMDFGFCSWFKASWLVFSFFSIEFWFSSLFSYEFIWFDYSFVLFDLLKDPALLEIFSYSLHKVYTWIVGTFIV